MHYSHWLVVLSSLISIVGGFAYIRDTLRGRTKPNRVTWSMWALAPLIATGAAISAGADIWALARIFLAGFMPLLVFLASFYNPKSFWKASTFDLLCGAASVLALLFWLALSDPETAIMFAIAGDTFAAIPTLRKSWHAPESESLFPYIASFVSVLLVLPSIPTWDVVNAGFSIYLVIVNALLIGFIARQYRRKTTVHTLNNG